MIMNKKMLAGMLLASAAMLAPSAASAQVAGLATASRLQAVMGAKAFKAGYEAIDTQNAAEYTRIQQVQTELEALTKPLDTNGDGELNQADKGWMDALLQRDALVKQLDTNKDGTLTGTEAEQFRAKNLPVQQILDKRQDIEQFDRNIQIAQLYVIDAINKQYDVSLKSIVASKKINAVFVPGVMEYAPKEMSITQQVITAIDAALPAVALPAPEKFSTSQSAVELQDQIDRIRMSNAVAAARAQQAQQQQGGAAAPAQPGQPAPQQPAPGDQPESR